MVKTGDSNRKCYGQVCTVARALDVVGDRWTLLVVRELLGGPARFNEILEGLPSVAKNLLTERLRRLEDDGVARRVGPAHNTQYALTEVGLGLRPVVEALGRWGANAPKVGALEHDRSLRSLAVALQTILGRGAPREPRAVIELVVDGIPMEIVLGPEPSVTARASTNADARIAVSRQTVNDYLTGRGFEARAFELSSGSKESRASLLRALRFSLS